MSESDIAGGAERVAWALFDAYRQRGHASHMVVSRRRSSDPDVIEIPCSRRSLPVMRLWAALRGLRAPEEQRIPWGRLARCWRQTLALVPAWLDVRLGHEDMNYPNSRALLDLVCPRPSLVHLHNLHGAYYDLRALPSLSRRLPVVLTLHDQWLLTGHCAHTLDCERWETGCGECPDLTIYPAIRRDATAWNWRRKQRIYQHSRLYVATPSQWLMDRVQHSILRPVERRVIHNGVNLDVFRPGDREHARARLRLPADAFVLLYVAHGLKAAPFRDYATIEGAVQRIAASASTGERQILFVGLGGIEGPRQRLGAAEIWHVPYQSDPRRVALHYQAADLYLHAARADNFPNTILEAMACGTPVIATGVGGIPEQVADGATGYLVPPGDPRAMAERAAALLADPGLREGMGRRAREVAAQRFDLQRQVDAYLAWFEAILEAHRSRSPNA
ncbi:MAG: glycosyltransferase [Anaerolineae bacterium]|nr:glycosyltransferase [Anaerolineae bacterium]